MSETLPDLLMMLRIEGARLGTELRGTAVVQSHCGYEERTATGGANIMEGRCENSRDERDEAENSPFRFLKAGDLSEWNNW